MENPAPWRVLEGPGAPAPDPAGAPGAEPPVRASRVLVAAALIVAGAIVASAAVLAVTASVGSVAIDGGVLVDAASKQPDPGAEIVIEVSGAVRNPGVYRLPASARVADAIEAAGGYGPRVDVERAAAALDLAALLADGTTVSVPSRDDPAASAGPGPSAGANGTRLVNLNTATSSELEALPGIGPVTAQKIIDARTERPFASVDELRERGLIGEKTFENLRDLVTIG